MANFKYEAKNFGGKTVTGTISGDNQEAAVAELRKRNLIVVSVKPSGGAAPKSGGLAAMVSDANPNRYSPKGDELVVFTRQLSTMVGAGIPLLEALEILAEQAERAGFAAVLDNVVEDIRGGSDLSSGFGKYPRCFSEIYVSMVRAGEASGQLDDILTRLAEYMEASLKLKRDIKAAMTYPVVSLFLVIGITMFLMLGIVPKFREVFSSMDIELPGLTAGVLDVAEWMNDNVTVMGIAAAVGIVGFKFYRKTPIGQWHMDWLVLNVPVFGPLFRKVALSRFSKTFATLVKSGVPILGALEIVSATSGNKHIAKAVDEARESVRQGDTLSEPLSRSPHFPPMVVKMIGIGERSGALENLLEKISEFYDDQVSAAVKSLTSLIEPIMIGVMGFLVGTIVLAVFLPIFELQKQLATRK
ncbi:MAG: Type II secretion system protein F [Planctomycetes bacterium]|nr:Type II secretion system protein F [Planctomycetota bacterium]